MLIRKTGFGKRFGGQSNLSGLITTKQHRSHKVGAGMIQYKRKNVPSVRGKKMTLLKPDLSDLTSGLSDISRLPITLGLSVLLTAPLAAQQTIPDLTPASNTPQNDATDGATTQYLSNFFDQFVPQNALDMIRRVPGFNLDGGNDARGFGGTAGNVLIDGSRPASKNGIRDILQRIPAAQVKRIEIIRGGVGASDAAGQAVVANVVRIKGASTGTIRTSLLRDAAGRIRPRIDATYSTTLDGWETSSRLTTGLSISPRRAEFETYDAVGNLTSSTFETRPERSQWAFYTGEAGKNLFGGRLTVNTRLGIDLESRDFDRDIFDTRLPDTQPDAKTFIDETENEKEFELGADWTKDTLNNWRLRVIGLTSLGFENETSLLTDERPVRSQTFLSDFASNQDTLESILRTTLAKTGAGALKPEFGAEVAYNQLKNTFDLFEEDEDGIIELDVPSSDVKVAEIRAEVFTNMVWQASSKASLNGGITWEISRLKVTGDASAIQTFKFLKPSLTATYNIRDNLQFQAQGVRQIGQLDFGDFAASNDASDDRVLAGNPELSPDKTWRTSATLDWRYSGRGSLVATYFHEWRDDILEQVILPSGGSGTGNAGSAEFSGIDIDAILPLDLLLPGGQIEVNYRRKWTSFFDPIIGEERDINGVNLRWLGFNFRQDITEHQVAWGVSLDGKFNELEVYVDEFSTFQGNDRYNIFIETTRFLGVKTRLEVERFTGELYQRARFFYDPNRGGAFTGSEDRAFRRGARVRLEMTRQF
jgi:hypothetical protein